MDLGRVLIYHMTHISNLQSILKHGGLLSNEMMEMKRCMYTNIAHQTIQSRRMKKKVPVSPYGTVHDYVPFYFAPRSPMLYAIYKGRVEGYTRGQDEIIYFVSSIKKIIQRELLYVFTDGHAIMNLSNFYTNIKQLNCIDWQIMKEKMWRDTPEDPDRSRRRQAEFLVYQFVPIDCFIEIGVKNDRIKKMVENVLKRENCSLEVQMMPKWYY